MDCNTSKTDNITRTKHPWHEWNTQRLKVHYLNRAPIDQNLPMHRLLKQDRYYTGDCQKLILVSHTKTLWLSRRSRDEVQKLSYTGLSNITPNRPSHYYWEQYWLSTPKSNQIFIHENSNCFSNWNVWCKQIIKAAKIFQKKVWDLALESKHFGPGYGPANTSGLWHLDPSHHPLEVPLTWEYQWFHL